MDTEFRLATLADLEGLVRLVGEYHEFESISLSECKRKAAIEPLIKSDSELGFVIVASSNGGLVGYIAVCFGYAIEFAGRDAFVDELYVSKAYRGRLIGSSLVERAKEKAASNEIRVLHLEVARENVEAGRFYRKHRFESRDGFHLMSCVL